MSRLDSTIQAEIRAEVERITSRATDTEVDLIVFDSDKPVDDSTGLPPVKAIVHKTTRTEQSQQESGKQQTTRQTTVSQQVDDHSTEQITAGQTVEDTGSWWDHVKRMLFIPALMIALWGIYKLYKLVK